jgi:hypothetical protein
MFLVVHNFNLSHVDVDKRQSITTLSDCILSEPLGYCNFLYFFYNLHDFEMNDSRALAH